MSSKVCDRVSHTGAREGIAAVELTAANELLLVKQFKAALREFQRAESIGLDTVLLGQSNVDL